MDLDGDMLWWLPGGRDIGTERVGDGDRKGVRMGTGRDGLLEL